MNTELQWLQKEVKMAKKQNSKAADFFHAFGNSLLLENTNASQQVAIRMKMKSVALKQAHSFF